MAKKIVSLDERIRKAHKLICSAEVNYFVCKTIQSAKGVTHPFTGTDFLLLASNNAFDACINTLHTLLSSTIPAEIRLKPILEELVRLHKSTGDVSKRKIKWYRNVLEKAYPNLYPVDCRAVVDVGDVRPSGDVLREICRSSLIKTGLADLERLRIRFESSHFHRIRSELTAHKNSQQPHLGDSARVFIKDPLLVSLGEIIKELRINACFWLGWEPPNPSLKGVLKGVKRALAAETKTEF